MRRRSRIDEGTEYYSYRAGPRRPSTGRRGPAGDRRDRGVTHQDQRLAERVDAAGSPIVVLLNKWDAVDTERKVEVAAEVGRQLHFLGESPVLRISARSGKGVHRLLARHRRRHRRLPPPGPHQPGQRGGAGRPRRPSPRRGAAASCTPRRARPTRRRSPCSPTASCPAPTSATSRTASGTRSTSGRRRSRSGCGDGADRCRGATRASATSRRRVSMPTGRARRATP